MRVVTIIAGLLAINPGFSQTVSGAGKFADPDKSAAVASSGAAGITHVGIAMLVVLMLVFAAAWAMRKFRFFHQRGQASIEVVQGVSLGAKERAVLIRVQGRRLLLGVAPGQVSLLTELADDQADDQAEASNEGVAASDVQETPSFKALLKRSMGMS